MINMEAKSIAGGILEDSTDVAMVLCVIGILMAMLSLAKIPYGRWLKFMMPLFWQLMLLAAVFLTIAVLIDYQ